jgi:hypothetical protein
VRGFERLAGRRLAWVYFSNNWWDGEVRFPRGDVERVSAMGRVPLVRLMARSVWREGRADPVFSMQSMADGSWDPQIHRWCADAAAAMSRLHTPLLAELGTEVNGDWFPWNGSWNGAGETTGYGDPAVADGPERFRDAYRRIVGICRAEGATGITWFFHVDLDGNPDAAWNRIAEYYPGDEWVDWIGVSDYGLLKPGWSAPDFAGKLDRGYDGVAALSYWHEEWRNGDGTRSDLQIDSSEQSLRAYRRRARAFSSSPRFTSRP